MARLFCGPDDSRWVQIDFATPQKAVATLLEAIRRDRSDVIADCLGQELKRRYHFGALEFQVAWQQMREQITGLHLLGYAEVGAPVAPPTATAATFVVEASGHRIQIDLVREGYREVRYRLPEGQPGSCRQAFDEAMVTLTPIKPAHEDDPDRSLLVLAPIRIEHDGLEELPLPRIEAAGVYWVWKVAELRSLDS